MRADAPFCPPPDPRPRKATFAVPPGACDTHAHVFGPAQKYPCQENRAYTPVDNPIGDLRAMHAALGIERLVLVQASVHGTDSRAVLDAVATDPERLRCIVAVKEDVTDRELRDMHGGGARGIRVNLVDKGGMPYSSLDALHRIGERIAPLGWHVELLVHVEDNDELEGLVKRLKVPVSVGHVGYTKAALGQKHPGYQRFLGLLRDGYFWVKLTGQYRISAREHAPYDDVVPFAQAVVEAAPERIVWGSDWPHVVYWKSMPNDGDLLNELAAWVPDAAVRNRILVDNPAQLYGFA
jgi:predicted TIM-barrel fold metal-dependent hydrolase